MGEGDWYVLCCNVCDADCGLVTPIPFLSQRERGQWATEHTKGTGHDNWAVLTQKKGEPFGIVYQEYLDGQALLRALN
jgi:Fe-S oxidoreductase